MADDRRDQPNTSVSDDYMRGGKGRKDEVGGSGIYPASAPNVPDDAQIRSEGQLVHHGQPRSMHPLERGLRHDDLSWGSE